MAITASQFDSLELTANEFDALGLTFDQFDKMTYIQILELVRTRLNREIPDDPKAMMEYIKSIHVTMEVMYHEMQESQKRENKKFWLGNIIGFVLGILAGIISPIILELF